MKNWQFIIIVSLLMSITSNVEDNHIMKVIWGTLSILIVPNVMFLFPDWFYDKGEKSEK